MGLAGSPIVNLLSRHRWGSHVATPRHCNDIACLDGIAVASRICVTTVQDEHPFSGTSACCRLTTDYPFRTRARISNWYQAVPGSQRLLAACFSRRLCRLEIDPGRQGQ
jgi:hypothetical protein